MSEQISYKGCDCAGTSSGPRIVVERWDALHGVGMKARLVRLACDVCDAAWSEWMEPRTSPKRPEGAGG